MSKIRVIYIAPGADAEEREVENTLEALQELVGGNIETVTIASYCVVVCNDEGRINGMPYNCHVCNIDFYGPVFFCGIEGDEFADMPLGLQMFISLGVVRRVRRCEE